MSLVALAVLGRDDQSADREFEQGPAFDGCELRSEQVRSIAQRGQLGSVGERDPARELAIIVRGKMRSLGGAREEPLTWLLPSR